MTQRERNREIEEKHLEREKKDGKENYETKQSQLTELLVRERT